MATLFSQHLPEAGTRIALPAHQQPVFGLGRAGACALALQVMLTGSARASCGDWLAHSGDSRATAQWSHDSAVRPTAAMLDEFGHSQHPSPEPVPCNGLFCGGAPMAPMPPAPWRLATGSDQFANLGWSATGDAAHREFAHDSPRRAAPQAGYLPRIEDPPCRRPRGSAAPCLCSQSHCAVV